MMSEVKDAPSNVSITSASEMVKMKGGGISWLMPDRKVALHQVQQ